jgi:predicted ArsR family transcriptional regulator
MHIETIPLVSILAPAHPRLLTDVAPHAPGVVATSRRRILDELRAAEEPLSAAEMAERAGLHLNTARFHLDKLVEHGHAERHTEARSTPGRPRIRYAARAAGDPRPRSYQLMARMLASLVATLDRDGTATAEAGRAWGRHLVASPVPMARVDVPEALARLDALMDAVGFAPETSSGAEPEMRLHHCPFLEVAELEPGVACTLHRGLIEGALGQVGGPVELEDLQPFVAPSLCIARLRRTAP